MPKFTEPQEEQDNVATQPEPETQRPFSDAQLELWKTEFKNIAVIEIDEEDQDGNSKAFTSKTFVMRGIGREEFRTLDQGTYRNTQDYENKVTEQAMVFPEMSELRIRGMDAGDVQTLYQQIPILSNVGIANQVKAVKFEPELHGPLCPETTSKDWFGWKAFAKDRGLFFCELEGKPFVYKNLSRSQYETYRTKVDKSEADKETAEEIVCAEGVVFPFADSFKPGSNQYMYGTISSLALIIMKQSGFGRGVRVVKI